MNALEGMERYAAQGYLIVPGLLGAADVARLNAEVCDVVRGKYPCESFTPLAPDLTDAEVTDRTHCLHQGHYLSPVLMDYFKHPGVVEILRRLIGPDIKGLFSLLMMKPPGCQGAAWHQDEIYSATRDRSLTGVMVALDDMDRENGCLWVVPGSHAKGVVFRTHPHGNPAEYDDSADEAEGFDEATALPLEIAAGTTVFFNGYTLHRSLANRSTRWRRAMVNHYMNANSVLLTAMPLRRGETAIAADDRRIVMVSGNDPYAWKGASQPLTDVALRTRRDMEALRQS